VLLIGWDAADWKVLHPLLDAGKMPALQRLVERGVMGNLATLDPPFSPMLWTSIATGKTADEHGILGFVEPDPERQRIRPVLGSSRKVRALWNMAHQSGLRTNAIGWWPSHPADPVRGTVVSNFYPRASRPCHEGWPMAPGTVHPSELSEHLAGLRVHPGELTAAHLLPFVPDAGRIDQRADPRLTTLARIIADAASIQAAATYLLRETEWDLSMVFFDAIDHFGHGFMRYHPPKLPTVSQDDFETYRGVVEAGYRFHDQMLDRLLEIAGDDCTVVLVSDHGFHSDHLRPLVIPDVPAGPSAEHRALGVFCMAGPGIKRDAHVHGAGLLDVTPTVLTLLGLPVGRDMPGRPLLEAFETPPEAEYVDSWESVEGDAGMHPEEARPDVWAEQEAIQQLAELGYVDPAAGDHAGLIAMAQREADYNLGRVLLSRGKAAAGLEKMQAAYEAAVAAEDGTARQHRRFFGKGYLQALVGAGRTDPARALLSTLRAAHRAESERARGAVAQENPSASVRRFAATVADENLMLTLAEAQLLLRAGDLESADALLDRLTYGKTDPTALLLTGRLHVALGRYAEARDAFERVLGTDPDNARAYNGLAQAAIGEKRYADAADAALSAVSALYHFPEAHYHYGVAIGQLGFGERALQAFQIAVRQDPTLAQAHRRIALFYRDHLRRPDLARPHTKAYHALRTPRRSGETS
jgi:arylsulfatase A-like enzyme/Flp pilus assembly protein TadD